MRHWLPTASLTAFVWHNKQISISQFLYLDINPLWISIVVFPLLLPNALDVELLVDCLLLCLRCEANSDIQRSINNYIFTAANRCSKTTKNKLRYLHLNPFSPNSDHHLCNIVMWSKKNVLIFNKFSWSNCTIRNIQMLWLVHFDLLWIFVSVVHGLVIFKVVYMTYSSIRWGFYLVQKFI